ncbi:hypothetical protein [Maricaulis virginensis]|uniref:Uncharacterized protein n=1 Tax=Maricaulis virginensis TaxID=144022 RepID=A0A9W6IJ64_9PROT|nr:hypothetical protein [Maricaulis virginensis]GLK50512.1 hypothetical protein GCM10017621_00200 [Maricaulis virginensis]
MSKKKKSVTLSSALEALLVILRIANEMIKLIGLGVAIFAAWTWSLPAEHAPVAEQPQAQSTPE